METDKLIHDLTRALHPVRRLSSPWVRAMRWLIVGLLCLTVGVAVHGIRTDFSSRVHDSYFWLQTALLLLSMVLCSCLAFLLSIPGRVNSKWIPLWGLTPLTIWFLYSAGRGGLVFLHQGESSLSPGLGFTCIRDVVTLGLAPGFLLFGMINKAAPLARKWIGTLLSLASASLGALGAQLGCSNDSPTHILVWHMFPVFALGLIGIGIGKYFIHRR